MTQKFVWIANCSATLVNQISSKAAFYLTNSWFWGVFVCLFVLFLFYFQ